jgi:hypothetical protein
MGATVLILAVLGVVYGSNQHDTHAPTRLGPGTTNCGGSMTIDELRRATEHVKSSLDALLKEISLKLNPDERVALARVQSNWEAYRDGHCKLVAARIKAGSALLTSMCDFSLTVARSAELRSGMCGAAPHKCDAVPEYDPCK